MTLGERPGTPWIGRYSIRGHPNSPSWICSSWIKKQTTTYYGLRFTINLNQHLLKSSSQDAVAATGRDSCLLSVLRFLMCDGGRGRLWRALLIASRVQLVKTRRTDLTPALRAAYRRWVFWLGDPNVWTQLGEDKRCKSHLQHTKSSVPLPPCLVWFWKCRFAEKAVKAPFIYLFIYFAVSHCQRHLLEQT